MRVIVRLTRFAAAAVLSACPGVTACLCASTGRQARADEPGMLYLKTDPPGATVTVGGAERGETPLLVRGLGPGEWKVELRLPGYVPATRRVAVRSGEIAKMDVSLEIDAGRTTGVLYVLSDPPGATVVMDGVERGVTPLLLEDLPVGEREFVVRLAGHRSLERRAEVRAGEVTRVDLRLDALEPRGGSSAGPLGGQAAQESDLPTPPAEPQGPPERVPDPAPEEEEKPAEKKTSSKKSRGAFLEKGGVCVVEAEHFHRSWRNADHAFWAFHRDEASCGGEGYVAAPPLSSISSKKRYTWKTGCELLYVVDIETPGIYSIAFRCSAPGYYENEAWVGLDGRPCRRGGSPYSSYYAGLSALTGNWRWVRAREPLGELRRGKHTIHIRRCEPGLRIDRFMIANDIAKLPYGLSYSPYSRYGTAPPGGTGPSGDRTGVGPPESDRGRRR
jgi:hypothetical protein